MTSDKVVIIKPEAYYKMLLHVLRFGNKARDRRQYRECMGILIGSLEGEVDKKGIRNVIIEDTVPISHGGAIEVAFAPEDYVTFSMVDAEYAEKGWFSCGWYHSHPGLDIFFSSTDIRNQLGWQTPNPSAVGIVFDHKHLETPGDLGFRTFRLDNPAKGQMSGYHEVETTVEPPDSIEYYLKLIELINCVHSKEVPILEINEMPDLFGDITFPSESQIFSKKPELDSGKILSTFKTGLSNFLELSITPFISFLNTWSEGVIKNTVDNNLQMRKDIIAIKENLSEGISNLQKDFKFAFKEKLNELDMYIDDRFEEFDSDQEFFKETFEKIKTELKEQFIILFEEKLKDILQNILKLLDQYVLELTEINNRGFESFESLDQQNYILENLSNNIKSIEDLALDKLKIKIEEMSGNFTKNANKVIGNFINLNKDTKSFLSDLKAAIILLESSKTPLKNKLDTQEIELKTLQKNIAELKKNNQELLTKIDKLEKGGE
ncbi:MAG: Mov34/MPN/PAD-1 family protein [Promethearchaeota archaeon]|nr:MAG: Mov34/MPN/PAD-1 family protein [Candidatus Lokiarchaeota archaeon]